MAKNREITQGRFSMKRLLIGFSSGIIVSGGIALVTLGLFISWN